MGELAHIGDNLAGTLLDVLPIAAILFIFQAFVLKQRVNRPLRVGIGITFVVLGLTLFLRGLQLALFPLGRLMAEQLTAPGFIFDGAIEAVGTINWMDYWWVYLFAGAIGFSTTIAEPALFAVAMKANQVSAGTISVRKLRIAVALGAAIGVTIGTFRIVTGTPLHWYIITGYVVVIIQTALAPRPIIPLAYDSGGVTTSTITVPLVAALGLGLAETIPGRSPLLDGFGLIALTALLPIMSVMAYAQLSQWQARRRTA